VKPLCPLCLYLRQTGLWWKKYLYPFWRNINSRLASFPPKLKCRMSSFLQRCRTSGALMDNKKPNKYISHVHYALKKIFSVKPPCPLCPYLRQTGLWWKKYLYPFWRIIYSRQGSMRPKLKYRMIFFLQWCRTSGVLMDNMKTRQLCFLCGLCG